jgi:hypothetical protein
MPPSKDPPASIVWAALRADVPDDAGREPPEFEDFEVGFEVVVAEDPALVEELFASALWLNRM